MMTPYLRHNDDCQCMADDKQYDSLCDFAREVKAQQAADAAEIARLTEELDHASTLAADNLWAVGGLAVEQAKGQAFRDEVVKFLSERELHPVTESDKQWARAALDAYHQREGSRSHEPLADMEAVLLLVARACRHPAS